MMVIVYDFFTSTLLNSSLSFRGSLCAAMFTVIVAGITKPVDNCLGLLDWEEVTIDWYHRRGIVGKSNVSGAARNLLCYDKTLMGIWTRQILDFIEANTDPFIIKGKGVWALPVVCAAALTDRSDVTFEADYLLNSYTTCFEDQLTAVPVHQIITGILKYGDIDDIIDLAGDKLSIGYRVDAQGGVTSE